MTIATLLGVLESTFNEHLELKSGRGLDMTNVFALSSCDWLCLHRNILLTGPTGSGKTYVSCALAQKACWEGYSAIYERASKFFHDLSLSKADGSYYIPHGGSRHHI